MTKIIEFIILIWILILRRLTYSEFGDQVSVYDYCVFSSWNYKSMHFILNLKFFLCKEYQKSDQNQFFFALFWIFEARIYRKDLKNKS